MSINNSRYDQVEEESPEILQPFAVLAEATNMSVQEIESAISQLPAQELALLMDWLAAHHERVWDCQIEDDLEAGRLDTLLNEVDQEYDAGLAEPL